MEKEINPSELTLWRVINKTPCNVELVSEYTSSTKVRFNGVIGYSNTEFFFVVFIKCIRLYTYKKSLYMY